jgi:hypothetical protein
VEILPNLGNYTYQVSFNGAPNVVQRIRILQQGLEVMCLQLQMLIIQQLVQQRQVLRPNPNNGIHYYTNSCEL